MLEVDHVVYRFPETTVQADFRLDDGQTIALMGQSGCGKTTILNMIAGFLRPASGDIRFNGQSMVSLKPAERPLSYLFQAHNLFPHLTVWQNLAIGINPGLRVSAADRRRIEQALDAVSMPGFADRLPTALSGGQQQRVGLARCLLRDRPLLLLDEPFSALDQALRREMIELVLTLQHQMQMAIVLATHQQADAETLNAQIVAL